MSMTRKWRKTLLVLCASALLMPVWPGTRTSEAASAGVADGYAVESIAPAGQYEFGSLLDVSTDGEGYVYAADYQINGVHKLTGDGTIVSKWEGDGSFTPYVVEASVTGSVYASDGYSIKLLDMNDGQSVLATIGAGQFGYITDIEIDSATGSIYATDSDQHKLWVVEPNGTINAVSEYENADSQMVSFNEPEGVALDGAGNIYVLEAGSRILKLNPVGQLIEAYKDTRYNSISAIDVSAGGTIYATDNVQDVVLKWESLDTVLKVGGEGNKDLQFNDPSGIAVDDEGNVFVGESSNYRVQKLDANLEHLATWGSTGGESGQFFIPQGITVDPNGNVYVADRGNNRVQKFDGQFIFIEERGFPGFSPHGMATDGAGNVYIATEDGELYKYDPANGTTVLVNNDFIELSGVSIDAEGNVYAADTTGHKVAKFPPDYVPEGDDGESDSEYVTWSGELDEASLYFRPQGIAVDSERNVVYVSDSTHIQTFTTDGTQIETTWGEPGNGEFTYISGIALDPAGNLYVADSGANKIKKLSATNGALLASWGARGSDPGQTDDIGGIAIDRDGNVYITDVWNHRVQKFAYSLNQLGGLAVTGGTLGETFDPKIGTYTVSVAGNVPEITLTPTELHPNATTIEVDGQAVDSGGASQAIAVAAGATKNVDVVVTASDGQKKTYTLAVTRGADTTPPPSTVVPNPPDESRPINVVTDEFDNTVSLNVTRKRSADGKKTDVVSLDERGIETFARHAAAAGRKTARIVIDDLPRDPADSVVVNLSRRAVNALDDYDIGLEIQTGDTMISLSPETLALLKSQDKDIVVQIVPIRSTQAAQQTADRVLNAPEVKEASPNGNAEVVGTSVDIETNYAGPTTKVVFPLTNVKLPTDPIALQQFLSSLGVYVEHSDGEKELQRGTVVYDAKGKPIGYEIAVSKFSAFTLVNLHDAVAHASYITGSPDGLFHPERTITRAELATLLARTIGTSAKSNAAGFSDVPAGYWATDAIAFAKGAGLMNGDTNGRFRPQAAVTRAEMATIIANWKKPQPAQADTGVFADAQGHWAAASIAAVREAGWMQGYENGTFAPDKPLTRAESVRILNRLLERPAHEANAERQPTWTDVPASHWAYADIESASNTVVGRP
ncbi:S-layer homology domain-containing protein [Cohnella sp. GCM10027633]|uniref:S-layer homology domain-containing protein n=1 Tax=unclassified Cohnella TaxID=2636738 RepID=UPI003640C865